MKTLLAVILYFCSESNVCKLVKVCVGLKLKGYMHKTVHERYLRFRMFLYTNIYILLIEIISNLDIRNKVKFMRNYWYNFATSWPAPSVFTSV